jgi:hypothetical protein
MELRIFTKDDWDGFSEAEPILIKREPLIGWKDWGYALIDNRGLTIALVEKGEVQKEFFLEIPPQTAEGIVQVLKLDTVEDVKNMVNRLSKIWKLY